MENKYNKLKDKNKFFVKQDRLDHLAFVWGCPRCGKEGYIFGEEAEKLDRNYKKAAWNNRKCKSCLYGRSKVLYKLDGGRAIHLNNIRRRKTEYKASRETINNIS